MSYFTTFIALVSFSLLLQTTIADNPYLYHICSSSAGNFKSGSAYDVNLNTLFTLLEYKTPITGFGNVSRGDQKDQVYGLALCRGDVASSDCKACVADASKELVKRCPHKKGAIIWYDYCELKYLNQDFLGKIDEQNKFYLYNVESIGNNPSLFNKKVKELLGQLSDKASKNAKFYAASEMKLDTFTNLYGLAQCTRDLSSEECKSCLDEAISELPDCCDGKQGGRVVGGSCNVRYEIYPFLNSQVTI